ncbi:MAG: glycosyltransferase family 4 protein [Lachnospiraceae bacterium]|nr:glycosyltransferase family 4 protein [Lachnospiraceae bacterium]
MRIGVYLIWLRPGIVGGTESFTRNLLKGFAQAAPETEFVLFTTKNNHESFAEFERFPNMHRHLCRVDASFQPLRIAWENLFFDREVKREGVDAVLIPVYCKPRSDGKVPYVTVIHDLQAMHFPEYFSKLRRAFLRRSWKAACRTSRRVVTISDYCRQDVLRHFEISQDRVCRIYDPIELTGSAGESAQDPEERELFAKLGIRPGEYDYCVSSLLPHKNLATVLRAVLLSKEQGTPFTLVVSGVSGGAEEFDALVREMDIRDCVIRTGFIPDAQRDALYRNCRVFLFPSVFEGFGMPPIEAMHFGKRVVCTKESCIYEVTRGRAVYVEDPYDEAEWLDKRAQAILLGEEKVDFPMYEPAVIAGEYMELFRNMTGRDKSRIR